jgi:adenine/guanine phosphoribosyltransferase-like PRPP-binding protein
MTTFDQNGDRGPAWKGLDTSRAPVFISYDQVERMIAALLPSTALFQPDAVVGITRGGIVPATMAAGILALPLAFLSHDKATGAVDWHGPPSSGQRVLLVDDCCSSGLTLQRARAWLHGAGRDCLTLVVVYDPDVARHVPDLSHPMRALFRLPWERGEATPTGRAAKAGRIAWVHSVEAPFTGIGLDEALLATIVAAPDAVPGLPIERAVLISDQPGSERARISAILRTTPYRDLPLECLGAGPAADEPDAMRGKAAAATRWGCTHFIEPNAEQAIAIAARAPHLLVTWWSVARCRRWIVGAAPTIDVPPTPAGNDAAKSRSSGLQSPPARR